MLQCYVYKVASEYFLKNYPHKIHIYIFNDTVEFVLYLQHISTAAKHFKIMIVITQHGK